MKRSLPFAPAITTLAIALGVFASPLRAQRARPFSVSSAPQARPASSQANGPHAGSNVAAKNRPLWGPSSGHSSSVLTSSSRFLHTNPRRLVNRLPTSGYYWIFEGGAYWVPVDSQAPAEQSAVDQMNMDETSGGQSVDSGQNGPEGGNASMQQASADSTQSAGEDSAGSPSATREEASASLPDEGQFTLVLNDGRWIEAVAFTHSNDTLVYITASGSRYTIAANELDSDSTLRVNQERGTPLQSPL